MMMDLQLFLQNFIKYVIEGLGVAVAAHLISGQRYGFIEVGTIGLSAAVTLMLLDMYAPSVAAGARQGTGFGLGMQVTNLPEVAVAGPGLPSLPGLGALGIPGLEGFQGEGEGDMEDEEGQVGGQKKLKGIPVVGSTNVPGALSPLEMQGDQYEPQDVSSHYKENCSCQLPCKRSCLAQEGQCQLDCPGTAPCRIQGSDNLASSNCPFKVIDGHYSKALLPGYNECVKPYNS